MVPTLDYLDAVIVTEGREDVQILEALLARWGWQRQEKEDRKTWSRGGLEIQVVPERGEGGGRGNIPALVSKYLKQSDLIIVVFDPDDQPYEEVIRDLFGKIWEKLQTDAWSEGSLEGDRFIREIQDRTRIRAIQDGSGRVAWLAFWPAAVWDMDLAHSMMDYVLTLLRQEKILEQSLRLLQQTRAEERISAQQVIKKHCEILKLLKDQGVVVSSSKRELDFLKALLGFREGYGKLGAKVIENKEVSWEDLEGVFGDMIRFMERLLAVVQRER